MNIHFVCRGNAFRSIIAEAYLNSLQIPGVTVMSSGTVASQNKADNEVKFPKTYAMLERRGVSEYAKDHIADDLTQDRLDASDVVVFANDIAHQEATARFQLPQPIYIWDVTDIGESGRIPTSDEEYEQFLEDVYEEIVKSMTELRKQAEF